VVKILRGNH